jgi:hypothetical protein
MNSKMMQLKIGTLTLAAASGLVPVKKMLPTGSKSVFLEICYHNAAQSDCQCSAANAQHTTNNA